MQTGFRRHWGRDHSYVLVHSTQPLTFPGALAESLSPAATIYVYGGLSSDVAIIPIGWLIGAGLTVTGLFLTAEITQLDKQGLIKWTETVAKRLKGSFATVIRKSLPLSQIVDAVIEQQTHATQGKTLVGNV